MSSCMFFNPDEEDTLIDLVSEYPPLYCTRNKDFKDNELKSELWAKVGELLNKNADACKTKWKTLRDYYIRKKREGRMISGSTPFGTRKSDRFQRLKFLDLPRGKQKSVSDEIAPSSFSNEENTLIYCKEEIVDDDPTSLEDRNDLLRSDADDVSDSKDDSADDQIISEAEDATYRPTTRKKTKMIPKQVRTPRDRLLLQCKKSSVKKREMIKKIAAQKTQSASRNDPIADFFLGIISSVKMLPPNLQLQAKRSISNVVFDLEQQTLSDQNGIEDTEPASTAWCERCLGAVN